MQTILASTQVAENITGYVYPNEHEILWSVLIVVYPYVTGLVAGAFILASLVRIFKMKVLEPAYRLSLLTSLAFLIAAPLPLLFHLGHPERGIQVMMTPNLTSPMAMFGFVYAWYLMAVLLLELWFEYRGDFVLWSRQKTGFKSQRMLYRILTLGVFDTSEKSLKLDHGMSKLISIFGIPSAFILHGYVGFIFGSIKANPLWGNVLIPIIFILSAIVSGIALCLFLFMFLSSVRQRPWNMACLDTIGRFLFYSLLIAFSLEAFDWFHRFYEAEESVHAMKELALGKLFIPLVVVQGLLGSVLPLTFLGVVQIALTSPFERWRGPVFDKIRLILYFCSSLLVLLGVLAMRWNVVIGGQLISKSLRGFSSYTMETFGHEGWFLAFVLMVLPFVILWAFLKLFLPEKRQLSEA